MSNKCGGCTKVSPGCKNCYAEAFSKRYKYDIWGPGKERRTFDDKHNNQPLNWNREALLEGKRHTVFCGSMMDWADEEAPAGERDKMWPLIKRTPGLMWLLLSKRAERLEECLPADWWKLDRRRVPKHYPNVALGLTIEADDYCYRADILRKIPAYARFISAEPLLTPLPSLNLKGIDWLIVGGESGTDWRKMDKGWAVDLRDKCTREGVIFFYKQSNGQFSGNDPVLEGETYKAWPKKFSLPMATVQ